MELVVEVAKQQAGWPDVCSQGAQSIITAVIRGTFFLSYNREQNECFHSEVIITWGWPEERLP